MPFPILPLSPGDLYTPAVSGRGGGGGARMERWGGARLVGWGGARMGSRGGANGNVEIASPHRSDLEMDFE